MSTTTKCSDAILFGLVWGMSTEKSINFSDGQHMGMRSFIDWMKMLTKPKRHQFNQTASQQLENVMEAIFKPAAYQSLNGIFPTINAAYTVQAYTSPITNERKNYSVWQMEIY